MKACICIISSRTQCLPKCLISLYQNFNRKYNYPVYVFYFDDIYDSMIYQEDIKCLCLPTGRAGIRFISVPYKTSEHIPESELYYNRTNLQYVQDSFSIKRKGYLHMCHFTSNMATIVPELMGYDMLMTHDDESGYTKELPYDPFQVMSERPEDMGAYIVGQRLREGKPHQGHLDTRINLWQFTKGFITENIASGLVDENKMLPQLKALLTDPYADYNFHLLPWADTYVIKTKMYNSKLWHTWINAVNRYGGIYKYRWGDNEVKSLFAHMHQGEIYNLKAVEQGYHNQGMFRSLQSFAPSVKDTTK